MKVIEEMIECGARAMWSMVRNRAEESAMWAAIERVCAGAPWFALASACLEAVVPDAVQHTEAVVTDPSILSGVPCVRGTRIPVFVILDYLAAGHTIAEIVGDFPELTEASVKAALAWASQAITAHGEDEHGADNR